MAVCNETGDVFFSRRFQPEGFTNHVEEIYAVRRGGEIERVTRNFELDLAGSPRATSFGGLALTDKCDIMQRFEGKLAIYWRDGVLAIMPLDNPYFNVGYEGNNVIPMISFSGNSPGGPDDHAALVRQPSGNCQVPSEVFPALPR